MPPRAKHDILFAGIRRNAGGDNMLKFFGGVTAVVALSIMAVAPAVAVSAKDKMATCKFGADDQKLAGKARAAFMAKCMSNEKGGAKTQGAKTQGAKTPAAKPAPKPAG
jgi:hypothetical protein